MVTPSRSRFAALIVATCLLATAPSGLAQSVSSSLGGTVATPEGSPIENALVTARSVDTGSVRTALTARDGAYRLESLAPGRYEVVVRAPDGNRAGPVSVELGLQQVATLNLTVLAGLTEEVTVTGELPLLDAERGWSELRIRGEQSDDLPVDGRVVTDLALLDSSITQAAEGTFYGERGSVFIVSGQPGRANSFLVDGLDNGDRTSSTTLNSFFTQQVIDEFVVMTRQFDPEFGRASGGVLNIVTRRGTNTPVRELFYQGTSPGWNSAGEFIAGLPGSPGERTIGRSALGLSLGGPLVKDGAFYFLSYERQRADEIFPYTGLERDLSTRGGVVGAASESDSLFLRTDYNLGDNNSLMLRVSHDERATDGLNIGGRITPEAGFTLDEEDTQFAVTLKTVFGPGLINEVRALAGQSRFDQRARSGRSAVERPSGILGGNDLNLQDRTERRLQLIENLAWVRGDHTLKFGLDVLRTRTRIETRFNPLGGFLYRTDETFDPGDGRFGLSASQVAMGRRIEEEEGRLEPIPNPGTVGFDDDGDCEGPGCFDDGTCDATIPGTTGCDEPGKWWTYPTLIRSIEGAPFVRLDDTQVALFAQDSWQASPKLTLSYGLRYDVSTFQLPEDARVPSEVIPNGGAKRDTDNLAPRFSFSYRPRGDGSRVINGAAGIFYDKIPLAFPALTDVSAGTQINFLFPLDLGLEITEDVVEESPEIIPLLPFFQEFALRFSTGTKLETPYVVKYSLGSSWVFQGRHLLSVEAEHALGFHQALLRDLNPVVGIGPLGEPVHRDRELGVAQEDRVGSIAAIVTEGKSWYTGLTTEWRWRSEENWILASHTWSRTQDLGFDPLKGGVSLPPDSDNIFGEKARADSDRRHRLVLAGGVPLPGGFRGSLVAQYASEAPFNVVVGEDENLDGFVNERLPGVGRNAGEDVPLAAVNELRAVNGKPPVLELDEADYFQV
ncbi:MAG: TonB-dependent receptor, partial [Acidobacteriota bacterium]|nr:TonB-dependent receptor [Acidobacteriota bacterium]